ncbi:MAG TPA: CSLREA domain-containing protein, partial [Blastocatellia bacterium]|nr:CSLREA domain-containing protein [Blastocatellia bacterium]
MKRVRGYQAVFLLAAGFALLLSLALTSAIAYDSSSSETETGPPVPMVFTVNSAADTNDGTCDAASCTLREAINAANNNPGADTINFQIGTGIQSIALTSGLPTVFEAVTLDGTTQPGFSGKPLIEINGNALSKGISGLILTGGNSTVRGLIINRFDATGLQVNSNNNIIQGNFIGLDATGTIALGNSETGIFISGANNLIGGTTPQARNVISGNLNQGIQINGAAASGNQVQGNLIGLDFSGTVALPNGSDGVSIFNSTNNIIGGAAAGARNVISGNLGKGVSIIITGAPGNQILGNYIGTDINGTLDRGNGTDGIDLF